MPELAKLVNTDLKRGFTVPQVAEKHACPACPVGPVDRTGVSPEDRTGGGRSLWSGLLHWKAKMNFDNKTCFGYSEGYCLC